MAAAKSMADAEATMVENLKKTSGKSLEEWLALLASHRGSKHGAIVSLLKSEHGMTHGYANLVAHKLLKSDAASSSGEGVDLVAEQYAGAKTALRPIYDAIVEAIGKLGADIELAPKKAYVSARRSKQFAILQPSTSTRFDLGLNLKGVPAAGRLEASGSWNAMVTHRVKLARVDEVNAELVAWIRQAYENA